MKFEDSQRGSVGVKVTLVFVVLFLVGNAGYNFIPTAYNGASLKQEMQAAILQGMTLPPSAGNQAEATKKRLQSVARSHNIPSDAVIDVKQANNMLQARIVYTKPVPIIPFGIYNYQYQFDYTAVPNSFLTK